MTTATIEATACICELCGYEWICRGELPTRCANRKCLTPAWNRDKKPSGRPKRVTQSPADAVPKRRRSNVKVAAESEEDRMLAKIVQHTGHLLGHDCSDCRHARKLLSKR